MKDFLLSRPELQPASTEYSKKMPNDLAAHILPGLVQGRQQAVTALASMTSHVRYLDMVAHVCASSFERAEWAVVQQMYEQAFGMLGTRHEAMKERMAETAKELGSAEATEEADEAQQRAACVLQRWLPFLHRRRQVLTAWRKLSAREHCARARLCLLHGVTLYKSQSQAVVDLKGGASDAKAGGKDAAKHHDESAAQHTDGISSEAIKESLTHMQRAVVLACRGRRWRLMLEGVHWLWNIVTTECRTTEQLLLASLPLQIGAMCVCQMLSTVQASLNAGGAIVEDVRGLLQQQQLHGWRVEWSEDMSIHISTHKSMHMSILCLYACLYAYLHRYS